MYDDCNFRYIFDSEQSSLHMLLKNLQKVQKISEVTQTPG
jgi:hypothetical protein